MAERLAAGLRTSLRNRLRPYVAVTCLFLLLLIALDLPLAGRSSFLLDTTTNGARIAFVGENNAWNLANATICSPKDMPDVRSMSEGSANTDAKSAKTADTCPELLFDRTDGAEVTISWPEGAEIRLTAETGGGITLWLVSADPPAFAQVSASGAVTVPMALQRGSFIDLSGDDWSRHGALVFSGQATIGNTIASGARDYLRSGRWEARQADLGTWFRNVVQVVKQGDFTLGVSVTVMDRKQPATIYGSITPLMEDGQPVPGMHLVALSETGRPELHLHHYGADRPSIIRPDWIDRISSSSILIAVLALMTLVATGFQIYDFTHAKGADPAAPQLMRPFSRRKPPS